MMIRIKLVYGNVYAEDNSAIALPLFLGGNN